MTNLSIDDIRTDGGTQSRAALNPTVVEDYAQVIRDGTDFPPVVVFYDGKKYWLADGFHRVAAYRAAGAVEIGADIRQGDKRDAILFSVGANAEHGLRRTNDDKRRAVMTLLNDAEWSKWSDREIARRAGVSDRFVNGLRPSSANASQMTERVVERGGATYTQNTANIGKAQKAEAKAARDAQQAEWDRHQEEVRRKLDPKIQRGEQAKAANGSHHAAVVGTSPAARIAELEALNDALNAKVEEQAEYIDALEKDLATAKAAVTKFDDMAVQFEKGGFDAVKATLEERIRNLQHQVETESADKVSWKRKADFWKKTAIELGYVSPNSTVEMNGADSVEGYAPF